MPLSDTKQKEIDLKVQAKLGMAVPDPEPEVAPEKTQAERESEAADAASDKAGINKPSYSDLIAHMKRFGPDGILESALHLSSDQKEKLAARVKEMKFDRGKRRWES